MIFVTLKVENYWTTVLYKVLESDTGVKVQVSYQIMTLVEVKSHILEYYLSKSLKVPDIYCT